jgi:dTDP-4-amino-4,6-dideoxygalactose transaminase
MFYLLLSDPDMRTRVLSFLNANGVNAVFHYVPLHSSAAGRRYGRVVGSLRNTDAVSQRLIRLPLWVGMNQADVDRVGTLVEQALAAAVTT